LEDPAEREFMAEGTGPIAHFLTRIGAYGSAAGVSPTDWLQPLLQLPPTVPLLLVHLLQATADELALLANRPNTWFVLNPRSNLFIHNTLPSHASFAPYANRLCLGTDSLASNHDLDLLAEVNTLLQADPAWDPVALLQAATLNGAEALGIGDEYGCLYPGARPGLLQIDYDAQARRFTLVRRWV
jgi:cytosine/adenosine deaminase-related metal-dependent hydrolase